MNADLRFVDLFAGLGGFHLGLANSGGFKCVFASELDNYLRGLYESNFGLKSEGDITQINEDDVPLHDVLCAGFPCQPFSLAGMKKGAECPESGKLIDEVLKIAQHRKPEFLIIENVPSILTIADGTFWKYIYGAFGKLGYEIVYKVISPEDVGIPHNRKRLFVVGSLNHNLSNVFDWPAPQTVTPLDKFLDDSLPHKLLEPLKCMQLQKWQQLLTACTLPEELPSLSISAQEFGATYPLDFSNLTIKELYNYSGVYGAKLSDCQNWSELLKNLPSYCKKNKRVPDWLSKSVRFSREIYKQNKSFLDKWLLDFDKRHNSWQVLEWRGYKDKRFFRDHVLQFRASGIRVMKPHIAPTLVAMTTTQVPIIGSEMRYLSKYEATKLQNLHRLTEIPNNDARAFKALGNSVNARIVELIASNIKYIKINQV